jgi:pimeloyl-ACP methyl ester carboxylesterase
VLTPPSFESAPVVRKRCVFYFSGFDPRGASHYHALYRDEALKQSGILGLAGVSLAVGPRQKTPQGNDFWRVTAQTPDGEVHTHYEFLRWDDIVRQHWPRNQLRLLWDIAATTALNLRTGALWRMFKLAWPPVVALFSPFVVLCAVVVGVPLLAAGVFRAVAPAGGLWVATAAAGVGAALCVQMGWWLEKKYSMLWLMRSYAFTAQQAQGKIPQLDARLEQHAATVMSRIEAAQDDEVLLVGHSSGTMLAVSVLANVLRRDLRGGARVQSRVQSSVEGGGPVVSLLTLGQCMPMLACLPQAHAFRDDLQMLARAPGIDWLDFSAPPDACCFPLVDPVAACGLREAAQSADRPKLLSPKFADMFDAPDYRALRQDRFRLHFQYLMAAGKPAPYDYFAITAAAMTLASRFSQFQGIKGYARFQIFGR